MVTGAVMGAVGLTALRFGVLDHQLALRSAFRYGFSGRALIAGHWATVVTSQLLTRDGFMAASMLVSLAVMLGGYELMAGSRRALVVAGVCGLAGPLVVAGSLAAGSALGSHFAGHALSTVDYGASAVTAGAGGALVGVLGHRRLRRAAVLFVVGGLLLHHQFADWEHLVSFPIGFGLGIWMGIPQSRTQSPVRATMVRRSAQLAGVGLAGLGCLLGSVGAARLISPPAAVTSAAVAAAGRPANPSGAPVAAPSPLSPARVIDTHFAAPSLGGTQRVLVLLPAGYDQSGRRYPVIEVLHGRPGRPEDMLTGIDLPDLTGGRAPFIAVVPDGNVSGAPESDFADTSHRRLGEALSVDLRAWAEGTFRTNGRWAVTGISSGGFGAAYLGSRRPGGYAAVCVMGGNFTADAPAFRQESPAVRRAASPLYHVSPQGPPTLLIVADQDRDSVRETAAYQAALTAVRQPARTVILAGTHDWPFWQRTTPRCLDFLLNVVDGQASSLAAFGPVAGGIHQ